MSKRPELYVVHGRESPKERKLYRLRVTRPQVAPAQAWPASGEWRELVRRLAKNPVKSE